MEQRVKRFITIMLATVIMTAATVMLTPFTAYALKNYPYTFGIFKYTVENYADYHAGDSIEIGGFNSAYTGVTNLEIPEYINRDGSDLPVTVIGYNAFGYTGVNDEILVKGKLKLPETLCEIQHFAFQRQQFTGELVLPDNLKKIGGFAFRDTLFSKLTISSKVEEIDEDAFVEMYNISSINNQSDLEIDASSFLKNGTTDYFVKKGDPNTKIGRDGKIGKGEYTRVVIQNIATSDTWVVTKETTYTGKPVTPEPTVTFKGTVLKMGTDYTVSYSNNTNVGKANITVTGIGKYAGTISDTFRIEPADQIITASDVIIKKTTADAPFNLGAKTNGGGQLSYISYDTNVVTVDSNGNITIKGVGKTTIQITANPTNNYNVALMDIDVTISEPYEDIFGATVSGISDKTYTGKPITQSPTVILNGKELKSGTDYTISYDNNVNVGSADMIITGKGDYTNSFICSFNITKAKQIITAADVAKTTADSVFNLKAKSSGDGELTFNSGNTKVVTVDHSGNVTIKGAGKTTIKIIAWPSNNYGEASKTINVTVTSTSTDQKNTDQKNTNQKSTDQKTTDQKGTDKKSIAKAKITGLSNKAYTGKAITQKFTVKLGSETLKPGTDYTVAYKNNKKIGTATVTVTGKGNYTGTATAKFKIKKAANSLSVKAKKKTYNIAYSKLEKKDQVIRATQLYKVSKKGQGALSYTLSSAKNGKKNVKSSFAVDKKTGKLTIKKRLKKGTYSVEINVTAAGDKTHNKVSKKISVSVKVK
jgi:hypothetical protein